MIQQGRSCLPRYGCPKDKKFNGRCRPLGTKDAPVVGSCQRVRSIRERPERPFWASDGEMEPPEGWSHNLWGRVGPERAQGGVRRARCASWRAMWEAGGLPADRLIELELRHRFAVLRVIGRGLVPIDGVPQGRGTRSRRRLDGAELAERNPGSSGMIIVSAIAIYRSTVAVGRLRFESPPSPRVQGGDCWLDRIDRMDNRKLRAFQ